MPAAAAKNICIISLWLCIEKNLKFLSISRSAGYSKQRMVPPQILFVSTFTQDDLEAWAHKMSHITWSISYTIWYIIFYGVCYMAHIARRLVEKDYILTVIANGSYFIIYPDFALNSNILVMFVMLTSAIRPWLCLMMSNYLIFTTLLPLWE